MSAQQLRRLLAALPVPTWRLVVVVAAASLVVLLLPVRTLGGLLATNLLVALVALADWWQAPRPHDLVVTRELPGVVPLDQPATVTWRVRWARPGGPGAPGRRSLRLRLADELAPSLRPATRRASLAVPRQGHAAASTTIRPGRRGRFTPARVTLRIEGPLGLAARQGDLHVPGTLRVYPPFRSRDEAELRITKARILEVGLRSAQGRGGGTEFDSLREYSVDDEFRRIDWAATARAGKAIVRTYRAERNQTVLMLLDAGRTMAGRVTGLPTAAGAGVDVPRLDHAMDAVMCLTAVATRLGDRAGLLAFTNQVHAVVPAGHARDQLARVTAAIYTLEPQLVESDYRRAFVEALTRFRRRTMLVLFTELVEQAVSETLLPALPLIARDHVVLVASVADPEVTAWARAVPAGAGEAYRKAAAVAALAERRRAAARLRGLGATVVDEPPGRLAPAVADAYLRAKASGRL